MPYLLPEFNLPGFNYRMTDLQGAIGFAQLDRLEGFIAERQHWAAYYRHELREIPWLQQPRFEEGFEHSFQAYVCYMDESIAPLTRNEFMQRLQERGLATRPGTHAVHKLGWYQKRFDIGVDDFPIANACDLHTLAIPLHNKMTGDDYAYVVEQIMALDY